MKTAITITARMKSTRLPLKAIKELAGKPVIEHLIERLKHAKLPGMIILCTSTNPQDDILVEMAKKNSIKFFRGSELDVLDRIYSAAKQNNVDFIISCTADNPLTDPHYVDKIIQKFKETDADFITALDLPLGAFAYGIKVAALAEIIKRKKEEDTEIWGIYFRDTDIFKKEQIEVEPELKHPEIRLTIDYPEDFQLLETIYNKFYKPNKLFELKEVVKFLLNNPKIMQINANMPQRHAPVADLSNFKR